MSRISTETSGRIGLGLLSVGVAWAAVVLFGGGIRLVSGGDINGEKDGRVKIEDCREQLYRSDRPWRDFFDVYTCDYSRNATGTIIGGTCVRVEYPTFSADCRVAHIYPRKSDVQCQQNYWPDPNGTGCITMPPSSEVR